MLSKEQNFFLTTLSEHINGRKTTVPVGIDEELLLSISKQQQCEGIIYYQSNLSRLQSSFASNAFYSVNRKNALTQIHKIFAENNIQYLDFKGSVVAQLYPVPQLRTMGDSDILVHIEDKGKAHILLDSIGFKRTLFSDQAWVYEKNGLELELHHALLYERIENTESQVRLMNEVWDKVQLRNNGEYSIEWEFHLLYLLLHLKMHLMANGVGFRQFLDLAVVIKKCVLDWDKLYTYIDDADVRKFADTCFSLVNKWFDIDIVKGIGLSDGFVDEVAQQIFSNGVFGFNNNENIINGTVNELNYSKSRSSVFWKRVFPSYNYYVNYSVYSFVRGKRYLLPFAWLYRLLRSIRVRRLFKSIRYSVSPYTQKNKITQRQKYLQKWGLITASIQEPPVPVNISQIQNKLRKSVKKIGGKGTAREGWEN